MSKLGPSPDSSQYRRIPRSRSTNGTAAVFHACVACDRRATRRPEVRVIDCNVCGSTIKAANDEELASELSSHMKSEHSDVEWDASEASGVVSDQAYEATDS